MGVCITKLAFDAFIFKVPAACVAALPLIVATWRCDARAGQRVDRWESSLLSLFIPVRLIPIVLVPLQADLCREHARTHYQRSEDGGCK